MDSLVQLTFICPGCRREHTVECLSDSNGPENVDTRCEDCWAEMEVERRDPRPKDRQVGPLDD